jgi:hypothetical protein
LGFLYFGFGFAGYEVAKENGKLKPWVVIKLKTTGNNAYPVLLRIRCDTLFELTHPPVHYGRRYENWWIFAVEKSTGAPGSFWVPGSYHSVQAGFHESAQGTF